MDLINNHLNQFLQKDTDKQQEIWDEAVELFHNKKFIDSIKKLAEYLDPKAEIRFENDKHKFELIQGSVRIYCRIAQDTFYAYINVLKVEYPDPIVFRRLLNLNAGELSTCRASIVKDYIRLTTETLVELASPSKIYWDLYELATHGDKLDDVLSIYSKGVKEVDGLEKTNWENHENEVKQRYFREWIKEALEKSEYWYKKNDLYVASWWLIGRIFTIKYFIQPEGKLNEELSDIIEEYNNGDRSQDENIKRVINRLRKISLFTDEEIRENFYRTKYTFQTSKPATKELITKYLEASLSSADRFKSLGHKDTEFISLIYGIGLLLINYIMDKDFTRELGKVYEFAHIDFMNALYPDQVKKIYNDFNDGFSYKVKRMFGRQKSPNDLSLKDPKDREEIIKEIRSLYDSVFGSD